MRLEDSPAAFARHAECLRKFKPGEASEAFRALQRYVETGGGGLSRQDWRQRRSYAALAAIIYNGRAMSELALLSETSSIGAEKAEELREWINEAITFRRNAGQTPGEVAFSEENQAIIAFRNGDVAEARCIAERVTRANRNLAWTWVVLSLSSEADGAPPACAGADNNIPPRQEEIENELSYFREPDFDVTELSKLLPSAAVASVAPTAPDIAELVAQALERRRAFEQRERKLSVEQPREAMQG